MEKKYENGKLVDLTSAEVAARTPTLAHVKEQKKMDVRQQRSQVEKSGITVSGLFVPTDEKTRDRIDQIVGAYRDGDITGTVDFDAPSGFVVLNETQIKAIKAAGAQHIQACFSRQKALFDAIDQIDTGDEAADIATVKALVISTGWPG